MQVTWLRQTDTATEVIVVFGGWAIGPQCFVHLTGAQNLLFVHDYTNLAGDLPDLGGYRARHLVAWSFGVAGFGHWQAGRSPTFDSRTAINGSLTPIHPKTGIPPRVFRATKDSLSLASYQDFLTNCHNAPQPWQPFDPAPHLAELQAIEQRATAPICPWTRVWISTGDRIFPPSNLERAWGDHPGIIRRADGPHVPFAAWSDWCQIWA